MITAIREVRRAKGLTLEEVAARCTPPTTPQTLGRLECGTRTVSLRWLARIATALGVSPAELVALPERPTLPVAALLDGAGAHAPRDDRTLAPPIPGSGLLAAVVTTSIGDYRAGDEIWLEPLEPARFGEAMNRDVLVPRPANRLMFGRLIGREGGARLLVLPPGLGSRQQVVADPPWIARAVRLVRAL